MPDECAWRSVCRLAPLSNLHAAPPDVIGVVPVQDMRGFVCPRCGHTVPSDAITFGGKHDGCPNPE